MKIETRRFEQAQVMETSGEWTTRRWFEYLDDYGNHVSDYPPKGHMLIEVNVNAERHEAYYTSYINGVSFSHGQKLRAAERWLSDYFKTYTFVDFPEKGFGEEQISYADGDEFVVERNRLGETA
jgi:hypothetical protein